MRIFKSSNGTSVSVWSTSTAGIDTVLATTLGATVAPKTFSTSHLHQTGLIHQPNGNGNGVVHHHPNAGNGTGLNHAHLHLTTNGNSHSGSIGNNSTHSLTPHGGGHGAGGGSSTWNNRTSICSTHNKVSVMLSIYSPPESARCWCWMTQFQAVHEYGAFVTSLSTPVIVFIDRV
uniref:Uncharacterized protein n=1 Tax=Anopheles farauti TaxID=69004 RepID=A0A182QII0_9DIPT